MVQECKFCYSNGNEDTGTKLLKPCACKGTMAYVCEECLEKYRQKHIDKCSLCNYRYQIDFWNRGYLLHACKTWICICYRTVRRAFFACGVIWILGKFTDYALCSAYWGTKDGCAHENNWFRGFIFFSFLMTLVYNAIISKMFKFLVLASNFVNEEVRNALIEDLGRIAGIQNTHEQNEGVLFLMACVATVFTLAHYSGIDKWMKEVKEMRSSLVKYQKVRNYIPASEKEE